MSENPTTSVDRPVRDRDETAFDLDYVVEDLAVDHATSGTVHILVDVLEESTGCAAVLEQFAQRATWIGPVARDAVHFEITFITDDQPRIGVKHAQRLCHVVERGG